MMTTTTMPVRSTSWNLCRCQCCVWMLLMMSFPRLTVSPSSLGFQNYCGMKAQNMAKQIFCGRLIETVNMVAWKWGSSAKGTQDLNPLFPLQPFQWRQWSRIPTWPCSSPVTVATLVSSRACGLDRARTWTESSSSLLRQSLNKAADSKTSPDKRTQQRILLV